MLRCELHFPDFALMVRLFCRLHPATRFLLWLAVALLTPALPLAGLGALAALGVAILLALSPTVLASTLRRTRLLLLTLMVAFAWTVPGDPVLGMSWSPTWQGLEVGGEHALRLLVLVCLIRVVLFLTPDTAQLAGLYTLMIPLRRLRLDPERMATLLWLALDEARQWLDRRRVALADVWAALAADAPVPADACGMTLQCPRFQPVDGVILALAALGVMLVWIA